MKAAPPSTGNGGMLKGFLAILALVAGGSLVAAAVGSGTPATDGQSASSAPSTTPTPSMSGSNVRFVLTSENHKTLDVTLLLDGRAVPLGSQNVYPANPRQFIYPYSGGPVSITGLATAGRSGIVGAHCEIWIGDTLVAPGPTNPVRIGRKGAYPSITCRYPPAAG